MKCFPPLGLPKIQSVLEINATPKVVYGVLTNTSYIIKIFRDAISVDVKPPGRSRVGQKYNIVAKAGRRKINIYLQVTELVRNKKVVTVHRPGGLFKSFKQTTLLEPNSGGTEARTIFEYELSLGYLGKILNAIMLERLIWENLTAYSNTVKELSELLPLTSPGLSRE